MAQRVVSIELSPREARVVVLETTLRRTDVTATHVLAVAEGADRRQVLAAVREAVGEPIDTLVVAADPRTVSTRLLHFPFADQRRLESAVAFELEGQVPYDLEETALTWEVVGRTPSSMEVLAALAPKQQVAGLIADAEAAGLEPRTIAPAAAGLVELAPHGDTDTLAIVSLGETTSHLAVVRKGELRLARTLRAGGADIDRALAREFGVELPAAREAKEREVRLLADDEREAASAEARRVSDAAAAGLAQLVTGLATTFKALPAGDTPARVLLTGGLSRLPGIVDHLAARLGLPAALVDLATAASSASDGPTVALLDRFLGRGKPAGAAVSGAGTTAAPTATPVPAESPGASSSPATTAADEARAPAGPVVPPEHALALGLAIAVARHGRAAPLNFRRGALAYQGDIQLYRGQVTRIVTGVAAVILLAIAGSIVRYSMLSAEERRLDAGFCAATKKIVGREICDPTAALATMRQAPGASDGVVIPPYSAGTLLEMMSRGIGKDIDVTFEDLELRVDGRPGEADRINGKGEAASFESTEQLSQSLKRDPCVQDVEVGKQRKTRDGGRVEFNLTVKVSCPPGSVPGQGAQDASATASPVGLPAGMPAGMAPVAPAQPTLPPPATEPGQPAGAVGPGRLGHPSFPAMPPVGRPGVVTVGRPAGRPIPGETK